MPNREVPEQRHFHAEQALGLWRGAEAYLDTQMQPGWAEDYETAINLALDFLQRYSTMQELLTAYFFSENRMIEGKDWLDAVCSSVYEDSSHYLNSGIVEDAAYFRRAKQLIQGLE